MKLVEGAIEDEAERLQPSPRSPKSRS